MKSANEVEGGVEAEIEWDVEWENRKDKATPYMLLAVVDWENEYTTENCWRLA